MTDKHEDTGQDQGTEHPETPDQRAPQWKNMGPESRPEKDPAAGDPEGTAGSGFTEAQLAELRGMFSSQGQSGLRSWVRGWWQKNRARARGFLDSATPPDEETDFDEGTFTGWLAARAARHRGVTAVLAVLAVLALGGLWVAVLGGGIPLPVTVLIAVIVLAVPVSVGAVFGRRRR